MFKKIIFCLLVFLGVVTSSFLEAAQCRKTGTVCSQGAATKVISGVSVYRACWQYQDTYECVDPSAINYCSAISSTPGCQKIGSVCYGTGFNGQCLGYTNTYRCDNEPTPSQGVTQLNDTYTIILDKINTSQCDPYSSNPSCQLSNKVCIEGAETRNINGLSVYKDCWKWKEDYSCIVNDRTNFCQPLQNNGCTIHDSQCTKTAFNGECIERKFEYYCGDKLEPLPSEIIHLDTSYTIIKDETSEGVCQDLDTNPNCTVSSKICVEGPETRNINGLDVYKDCWKWEKEYACTGVAVSSNCEELKNREDCQQTDSACVPNTELPSGQCGVIEHQYRCVYSPGTTSTITSCSEQTFCIGGKCFDTSRPPDKDFALAISGLELQRQSALVDLFNGEANSCSNNPIKKCCRSKGGGQSSRNDSLAKEMGIAAVKLGGTYIYTVGSMYVWNGLINSGSDIMRSWAISAAEAGFSAVNNVSLWGLQFAVGEGGIAFVGFDPWSLAMSVAFKLIMDLMQCDPEDNALAIKRGQNLCHKVGSYCASKVLKACVKKAEGWCCFPSKLGKIIQVQGKRQLGKSFGDPKSPNCAGFTPEELQKLRFDEMDLSEFIHDVVPGKFDASQYGKESIEQKAKDYYDN